MGPPPGRFPAFVASVLFAAGILLGEHVGGEAVVLWALLLAIDLGCLSWALVRRSSLAGWWTIGACVLAGMLRISADHGTSVTDILRGSEMTTMEIEFSDVPATRNGRVRCVGRLLSAHRGRVTWTGDEAVLVTVVRGPGEPEPPVIAYGMRVRARGTILPPSEARNPGEMSPREYYAASGITALVDLRGTSSLAVLDTNGGNPLLRSLVFPARAGVLEGIDRTIGGEEGEFLKGLLIGERSGLRPETREAFVDAGVAHVLAVSGSNVALFAAVVVLLLEILRLGRMVRFAVSVLAVVFYMLVTGSQPPVVRATAMAIVFFLGRAFGERTDPYNVIGVAALWILVRDGRQLFDVGFQLSFLAVLSLVHLGPVMVALARRVPGPPWVRVPVGALVTAAGVSLAATLGTLPVTALSFGKVSIVGLAANAVVVPATGMSVILGTVTVLMSLVSSWAGGMYAALNGVILDWTLRITELAARAPFAVMDTHRFAGAYAVPYYALLGLAFHGRRPAGRRFFLLLLLGGLNAAVFLPSDRALAGAPGLLRFTMIDVGQGDALLVEPPDALPVLIDAGPASPGYNAAARVIVPLLQRRGIRTLGILLVTHAHDDHAGGTSEICSAVVVKRLVVNGEATAILRDSMLAARCGVCVDTAWWGMNLLATPSTRIRILSPPPPGAPNRAAHGNNASLVVRVEFGAASFLLTGDAEGPMEDAMQQEWGDLLRSTVLKVAHHGGNTGTTDAFLDAVHPAIFCISVGARNRFGHPSPLVLSRLAKSGGAVFRTDEEGAIVLESDGAVVRRVLWR